ncbi:hypothetical protein CPB85DRAFT_1257360, partial [Mucidula mucida]
SSLVELKTRAFHRPLDWDEVYISLRPPICSSRTFSPVVKYSLESIRGRHESQAQDAIGKLEAVLSQIQEEVQKVGKGVDLSLLYKVKKVPGKGVDKAILRRF